MNPDCNYLAYLRNQCYRLRKFNYFFDLKMSAFGRLAGTFGGAVAATALLVTPACAQEDTRSSAQPTQIAFNTSAPANDTEELEAWERAQDHSLENVGISYVIYGRTSNYSNDRIAQELNALFYEQGLTENEVRVWQANPDQVGVGIGMYVDGAGLSENTLSLSEAVAYIPRAVTLYREHAPIMRERLESERRARPVTSAALTLGGSQ